MEPRNTILSGLVWGNTMEEILFNAHLACLSLIPQTQPNLLKCREDQCVKVEEYLDHIFNFWCVNPTSLFSE
jgi:hypothetical protein